MPDNWQPLVSATYTVRHYGTAQPGLNDPLLTPTVYCINPLYDASGTPAGNPSGLPNLWKNEPYVDVFGQTHPWANQANPYLFTQILEDPPPAPADITNVRVSQTLTIGAQLFSYDPHYEFIQSRFGYSETIEHFTFGPPDLSGLDGATLVLTLEWRTLGGGFGSPPIDVPLGTDGNGTTFVRLMPPLPLLGELSPVFVGTAGYHGTQGINPFHLTLTAIMPDGSRKNPNKRLAVATSVGAAYASEINTGTNDGNGGAKSSKGGVAVLEHRAGYWIGFTAGGVLKVERSWHADHDATETFVVDEATSCAEPRLAIAPFSGLLSCVYRQSVSGGVSGTHSALFRRFSHDYGETWLSDPSAGKEVKDGVAHAREVFNERTDERCLFFNDGSGKDSGGVPNGTGYITVEIYSAQEQLLATATVSDKVTSSFDDAGELVSSVPDPKAIKSDATSFDATYLRYLGAMDCVFESEGKLRRFRSYDDARTWSEVIQAAQ